MGMTTCGGGAEITQLGYSTSINDNIFRLDISMDDAMRV